MNVVVKATVNPAVSSLHKRLVLSRADVAKAVEAGDAAFRALMAANFATQGSAGGPKWADNTAFTKALKASLGYPDRVLVRTGGMERGLTQKGGDHVARVKSEGTMTSLEFGAQGRTADLVEANATFRTPRDAAQLTEEGKKQITDAIREEVRNVIRKALVLEVGK